jgi:hypothetical protein
MTIDYINKKKKLIKFLKTNNIFNKSNLIKYENLIEISKNFTNTKFKKKFFWYQHVKKRNQSIIKFKKIQHLNHWIYDKDKGIIKHKSGHFFSIIGVSTKNANREVKSWDQPFIKQKNFSDTLKLSEILSLDQEDLIHKAVGWMLREMGKREEKVLLKFLNQFAGRMPRTMLRYAIEKLKLEDRIKYLTR